jgi:hypothetical protein
MATQNSTNHTVEPNCSSGSSPTKRNKYVYPSTQVPHLWAHQTQDSARNSTRNIAPSLEALCSEEQNSPDFEVDGGGSVYLLRPLTPAAREWVDEHISQDAQRLGNAVAVEHRYIEDIVAGVQRDGLTVAGGR